jgi:hypothetical protein
MAKIFKAFGSAVALAGLVSLFPVAGMADGPQAVATAAQHAGLAASSGDIAGVQRHLHHTLNCLVGPEGEGFDQSAGNPCQAAGGAIPQTADAEMRAKLVEIAAEVRGAIASSDLEAAKEAATDVQEMLAAD